MRTDACATLYTLRYHSIIPRDPEELRKHRERIWELVTLINSFAIEEIEIHHYGNDYVTDCPAIKDRKAWPTKDVYGRYGCVACDYYKEIGLRHVRCRWRAAQDEEQSRMGR